LNAGLIDEAEARTRREDTAREADFYGAMDGASKFVRGDAIAAVVMIIVNIVGGFVIGMAQRGMGLSTALRTYTLLTIGEGLVTQIPALIMATATGLIITRSASGAPLGRDLTGQLLGSRRAAILVAITLGALALVPGLPKLPFLAVAAGVGLMAGALGQHRPSRQPAAPAAPPVAPSAEQLVELIAVDPIELELGLDLVPMADPAQGGDLLERITALRRRIAEEMGLMAPPLRVRDNLALRGNAYALKLSGARVAQGEVRPGHVLVMSPTGGRIEMPGIDTTEPAFGMPARWVPEGRRVDAEMAGCTVVDGGTVVLTHLEETLKRHAAEILTLQDVRTMLDHLREQAPALVEELVPKVVSVSEVHQVLTSLLRERVPIRDLGRVLTSLAAHAPRTRDTEELTELTRRALARVITSQYAEEDQTLWVSALDPAVEAELVGRARAEMDLPRQEALPSEGRLPGEARLPGEDRLPEPRAGMEAGWTERLVRAVKRQMERLAALGHAPVLLCGPAARPLMRALLERGAPGVAVLSHAEIAPEARVRSVGLVQVGAEDERHRDELDGGGAGGEV